MRRDGEIFLSEDYSITMPLYADGVWAWNGDHITGADVTDITPWTPVRPDSWPTVTIELSEDIVPGNYDIICIHAYWNQVGDVEYTLVDYESYTITVEPIPGEWPLPKLDKQEPVLDKDLTEPPGSPSEGDRYIIADSATGDWEGYDDYIAEYEDEEWSFETPEDDWVAWVEDESEYYYYDDGWELLDEFNDKFWDETDGWVDNIELSAVGGGRYSEKFVAVTNKGEVYYL